MTEPLKVKRAPAEPDVGLVLPPPPPYGFGIPPPPPEDGLVEELADAEVLDAPPPPVVEDDPPEVDIDLPSARAYRFRWHQGSAYNFLEEEEIRTWKLANV